MYRWGGKIHPQIRIMDTTHSVFQLSKSGHLSLPMTGNSQPNTSLHEFMLCIDSSKQSVYWEQTVHPAKPMSPNWYSDVCSDGNCSRIWHFGGAYWELDSLIQKDLIHFKCCFQVKFDDSAFIYLFIFTFQIKEREKCKYKWICKWTTGEDNTFMCLHCLCLNNAYSEVNDSEDDILLMLFEWSEISPDSHFRFCYTEKHCSLYTKCNTLKQTSNVECFCYHLLPSHMWQILIAIEMKGEKVHYNFYLFLLLEHSAKRKRWIISYIVSANI